MDFVLYKHYQHSFPHYFSKCPLYFRKFLKDIIKDKEIHFVLMPPDGFEPPSLVPKTSALSIEL